jgi:hypothetical protein
MPGQVDRDHKVAPDETRDELDPVAGRTGKPVQEQERLAGPADVVLDRSDPSGLKVRCSRHPGKVSFADHGDFGDAGPLIPANNERAMSSPPERSQLRQRAFSWPQNEEE